MRFSVVIPTHNRSESLRACLAAVCEQDYPHYEVIVVDDASDDDTELMMASSFPDVRYLRQEENRGPAAARNRGIEAATGDVVAFTDDDCIVPEDWLSRLADGFQRHPAAAGVGGYQEAPPTLVAENAIARADHLMRLRRWGGRAGLEQLGGYEVPGLATNNVAYRRRVLLAAGGFDEGFPVAAGEDADLKLRIARAGHSLLYLPLGVYHHRPYTWKAQWRMAFRRGEGAYHFEVKHGRPPSLVRIFLRLAKRSWHFPGDLFQYGWNVALVIYLTGLADALGQLWTAVARSKTPRL